VVSDDVAKGKLSKAEMAKRKLELKKRCLSMQAELDEGGDV